MDALLAKYLLHEVSNITTDFVNNLVNQVKKQDICQYVTHFICAHALTNNIWVLQQIKTFFTMIETCKPSEKSKLAKIYYAMFHLIGVCDKAHFVFHQKEDRPSLFMNDIKELIYTSNQTDCTELEQLKDVLTEDVYHLLLILYDSFLYSVESKDIVQKCFLILRYLITLTPKQYLASGNKMTNVNMDILDFVFLTCILYSNSTYCLDTVKLYVNIAKDIFYFKGKKKDKMLRVNLLFYTMYIILNKDVKNQAIDFEGMQYVTETHNEPDYTSEQDTDNGTQKSIDDTDAAIDNDKKYAKRVQEDNEIAKKKLKEKLKYLYIYTDVDESVMFEMQLEREKRAMMAKLMRSATKEIDIDYLLTNSKDHVMITKLHH